MPYRVDLAFRVDEALADLPEDGRQEVMETIANVLVHRDAWPSFGCWEGALWFGARCWVAFTAYPDGIDVYDVGWAG